MIGGLEHVVADGRLGHDHLDEPGSLAERQEVNLAARAPGAEPSLNGDGFALVPADVLDVDAHVRSPSPQRPAPALSIFSIRRSAARDRTSVSRVGPRGAASTIRAPS